VPCTTPCQPPCDEDRPLPDARLQVPGSLNGIGRLEARAEAIARRRSNALRIRRVTNDGRRGMMTVATKRWRRSADAGGRGVVGQIFVACPGGEVVGRYRQSEVGREPSCDTK
jgi:hypothetical protein